MNEKTTLYFAYGSNLDPGGMSYRCPTAKPLGPARLDDWRLTFRGVADIVPAKGTSVRGALWLVTEADIKSLDRYEGAPHYYRQDWVTVDFGGKLVKAMTYIMVGDHEVGLPSPFYLETIATGFRHFGLPIKRLKEALELVREEHEAMGITLYHPRGKKRLMAEIPADVEIRYPNDPDFQDDGLQDYLDGMSPATRALHDLEQKELERKNEVAA